jgi:hypothetical protein
MSFSQYNQLDFNRGEPQSFTQSATEKSRNVKLRGPLRPDSYWDLSVHCV